MIMEAKPRLFTSPGKAPTRGRCIKLKQVVGSREQLEEDDIANDYNLLENGKFDRELSYWKTSRFGENDVVIVGKLCINGDISTRKNVSQTPKINMKNPVFLCKRWNRGSEFSSHRKKQKNCGL